MSVNGDLSPSTQSSFPDLHRPLAQRPNHRVLAANAKPSLIGAESGGNLSPKELQGKYTVALRRIGGKDVANRHRPIYQRDCRTIEDDAIADAAAALRALWKLNPPVTSKA